jgi:hypothetical protein
VDGDANDLALLLAAAARETNDLREDARLRDVPGSRGAALRSHLLDLLDAIDHRIARPPSTAAPEAVRRAFARSVRQAIHVLRGAHVALPWIEATRSPHLNMGSLYLAEECAKVMIGQNVDLVVIPNEEYMYSTTSWPFAEVVRGTHGFTPKTQRRPIVLNYPLGDSDRLLMHPIFAHELGHASCDEHNLVDKAEALLVAQPTFLPAFEEVVSAMRSQWPRATETQISGNIRARLRSWLEEVICDHLAVQACGPAFIWAFAMFAMPFSYGEPGRDHPPNTLRACLALLHLDRQEWSGYMETVAPVVTSWLKVVSQDSLRPHEAPFEFLRDQILNNAEAIQDLAIDIVGESSLDASEAATEASEAATLLDNLILPLEANRQLEPRPILVGGWEAMFRAHGDGPASMVAGLSDQRIQDLVGKAMEMSVITTAWSELP